LLKAAICTHHHSNRSRAAVSRRGNTARAACSATLQGKLHSKHASTKLQQSWWLHADRLQLPPHVQAMNWCSDACRFLDPGNQLVHYACQAQTCSRPMRTPTERALMTAYVAIDKPEAGLLLG
jgi:hypothetical protein